MSTINIKENMSTVISVMAAAAKYLNAPINDGIETEAHENNFRKTDRQNHISVPTPEEKRPAVYIYETVLTDGKRVIKLGYTSDMITKNIDATFIYFMSFKAARKLVINFNEQFKSAQIIPNFFPEQYKTLMYLSFENYSKEMEDLVIRNAKRIRI